MKVGDLVKVQTRTYSHPPYPPCCGVVSLVEKEFYQSGHVEGRSSKFKDRITVIWQNGDESIEPESFLEVVSESRM